MLKEAQSRWGIPRCLVGGTRSSDPVPSYLYARQIYNLSANSQTVGGDIPLLSANYFMQLHHKIPQAHKQTAEGALSVQCPQRALPARSSGKFC